MIRNLLRSYFHIWIFFILLFSYFLLLAKKETQCHDPLLVEDFSFLQREKDLEDSLLLIKPLAFLFIPVTWFMIRPHNQVPCVHNSHALWFCCLQSAKCSCHSCSSVSISSLIHLKTTSSIFVKSGHNLVSEANQEEYFAFLTDLTEVKECNCKIFKRRWGV